MIRINNREVEFDIMDINDARNYNNALDVLQVAQEKISKMQDGDFAIIETMLQAFKDFIYEATGVDALYDVTNVETAIDMYKDFVEQVSVQAERLKAKMSGLKTPERLPDRSTQTVVDMGAQRPDKILPGKAPVAARPKK